MGADIGKVGSEAGQVKATVDEEREKGDNGTLCVSSRDNFIYGTGTGEAAKVERRKWPSCVVMSDVPKSIATVDIRSLLINK